MSLSLNSGFDELLALSLGVGDEYADWKNNPLNMVKDPELHVRKGRSEWLHFLAQLQQQQTIYRVRR